MELNGSALGRGIVRPFGRRLPDQASSAAAAKPPQIKTSASMRLSVSRSLFGGIIMSFRMMALLFEIAE